MSFFRISCYRVFFASILLLAVYFTQDAFRSIASRSDVRRFRLPIFSTQRPPLPAPIDYEERPLYGGYCEHRYGLPYLYKYREHQRSYCEPASSQSHLTCFHHQIQKSRTDSFCVADSVIFDPHSKQMNIDCQMRDWEKEKDLEDTPKVEDFYTYMVDTGPGYFFNNTIQISQDNERREQRQELGCQKNAPSTTHTIALKREFPMNIWHSLNEIFSLYLTLDILQMSRRPEDGRAFFQASDVPNVQLLFFDDQPEGPYWDLWKIFTGLPIARIADTDSLDHPQCISNLVVPIPGNANPLWVGDWNPGFCTSSVLLKTFTERILGHFGISNQRSRTADLTVTLIDRKGRRHLHNTTHYMDLLRAAHPGVQVTVVDFAAFSLEEQLRIVSKTDILVGVHGAGLTHSMFLPDHSTLVEIFPPTLKYEVYRNVAKLRGHNYFSDHATKSPNFREGSDWHDEEVYLNEKVFVDLLDVAIKSMYHRGTHEGDVN